MADLTDEQRDIIRHSLGLDYKRKPFRNFYADEPDAADLNALVTLGLMQRGRIIPGGLCYFLVTEAGAAAVGITAAQLARADR